MALQPLAQPTSGERAAYIGHNFERWIDDCLWYHRIFTHRLFHYKLPDTKIYDNIIKAYEKQTGKSIMARYITSKVPADFIIVFNGIAYTMECKYSSNAYGLDLVGETTISPHQDSYAMDMLTEGKGGASFCLCEGKETRLHILTMKDRLKAAERQLELHLGKLPWEEISSYATIVEDPAPRGSEGRWSLSNFLDNLELFRLR